MLLCETPGSEIITCKFYVIKLGWNMREQTEGINLDICPQVENEAVPDEVTKEESDEEDEEDGESGRLRFKSERKDGAVVRLADAGSKRRNIPATLGMHCSSVIS